MGHLDFLYYSGLHYMGIVWYNIICILNTIYPVSNQWVVLTWHRNHIDVILIFNVFAETCSYLFDTSPWQSSSNGSHSRSWLHSNTLDVFLSGKRCPKSHSYVIRDIMEVFLCSAVACEMMGMGGHPGTTYQKKGSKAAEMKYWLSVLWLNCYQ